MPRRPLTVTLAIAALACAAAVSTPWAQTASKDIRIAHIMGKTGALEAYAKQSQVGFMMGLEYATGGSMTVAGRKLVVIEDRKSVV